MLVVLATCALASCQSKPLPQLTAAQQDVRKQKLKLMFARLIGENTAFGVRTLLNNPRHYSNATVVVPARTDLNVNRICAKVTFSSLGIMGQTTADLSAGIIEVEDRIIMRMGTQANLGSICEGTYEPFPELEALSPKGPA